MSNVKTKKEQVDAKELSFEGALHELTALVEKLELGQMSLEDSVASFEQGVQLSRRCEALLDAAEQRLDVLNEPKK
ncbi:MAG: exodeoxyribonuclease VII small subunit [Mariprofundaceae bacterium]|nr:exodeoxyribonuclease VII small subunit [Mariprofundaceae bacterium]